jgi:D-lactate dehydrogenase (cytochrome)
MLDRFRRDASNLTSFEVMWPAYFEMLALRRGGITPPVDIGDGMGVIVELTGNDPETDEDLVEGLIGTSIDDGSVTDAFLARSVADTEAVWGMREAGPMDGIVGLVHFDIGLPTGSIHDFLTTTTERLRQEWPQIDIFPFGHIGDSNLHITASVGYADEAVAHRIDDIVYATVAEYVGSVSAEHGIGTIKSPYLHHSRTDAEIDVMRRLKAALDPHGILNPGKVIPLREATTSASG